MLQKIKANLPALFTWGKLDTLLRKKMLGVALVFSLIVGGATFWLGQSDEKKGDLRERLAATLDASTAGTPLEGSGNLLRKEKPVNQPEGILHPATNPGTFAGPVIREETGLDGMVMPDGSIRKDGEKVLKPVAEDSRLSKNFLADLAAYIAKHYVPGAPGSLNLKLASVNQHCSSLLNTEPGGGRKALLNYAFQPTMLKVLYQFYADYFVNCLEHPKIGRKLNPAELADFFKLLAQRLAGLKTTIGQILDQKDLPGFKAYEDAQEDWESLSAQLTLADYDLAQLLGLDPEASDNEVRKAKMRVAELTERLEQAQVKRDDSYYFFLENLKGTKTILVDDATLIFIALWMQRRNSESEQASESFQVCQDILEDLRQRLELRAKDLEALAILAPKEEPADESKAESRLKGQNTPAPKTPATPQESDLQDPDQDGPSSPKDPAMLTDQPLEAQDSGSETGQGSNLGPSQGSGQGSRQGAGHEVLGRSQGEPVGSEPVGAQGKQPKSDQVTRMQGASTPQGGNTPYGQPAQGSNNLQKQPVQGSSQPQKQPVQDNRQAQNLEPKAELRVVSPAEREQEAKGAKPYRASLIEAGQEGLSEAPKKAKAQEAGSARVPEATQAKGRASEVQKPSQTPPGEPYTDDGLPRPIQIPIR